jgi:hypothetical protein
MAEVVCDAGDAAKGVVVVGAGGVDLADDRMLGAGEPGQCRHRRSHPVAPAAAAHGVK